MTRKGQKVSNALQVELTLPNLKIYKAAREIKKTQIIQVPHIDLRVHQQTPNQDKKVAVIEKRHKKAIIPTHIETAIETLFVKLKFLNLDL